MRASRWLRQRVEAGAGAHSDADPDTPTACICDGGAYEVKDRPFLVHPACPVHRPDTPTADAMRARADVMSWGCSHCGHPGGEGSCECDCHDWIPTADAPADTDPAALVHAMNVNRERLRDLLAGDCSYCGHGITQHPMLSSPGWCEGDDCDCNDTLPQLLATLVVPATEARAQVEAARRDALNQAADEWPAYQLKPSECRDLLRDRAARGETRQP